MQTKKIKECAVTIILPTLNEEDTINALATELLKQNYYIIVSDDGSIDNTKKIVERLAVQNKNIIFFDHTIHNEKGIAKSIIDATKFAKTEKIIVMDADFQHPTEKISNLIFALDNVELAVCCRIKNENWGIIRELISFGGNFIAHIVFFLRNTADCSDSVSGFFGFRKSILQKIDEKRIIGNGFKILIDILKQLPRNTPIIQIPYIFINRKNGNSKFNISQIFLFLRSLFS